MSRAGVRVAGSAILPFRRARDDSALRDWLSEASAAALADAGLEAGEIDALVVAMESDHLALQLSVGALAADEAGLVPKPVFRVEMGGASGAAAVHAAAALVGSGAARRVLVLGAEQAASHLAADDVRLLYGLSFDADLEGFAGAVPANLYALSMAVHIERHGTGAADLAAVAVKNLGNAAHNPLAHRRRPVSEAEVLASPPVSLPYKALDCSVLSDAAAALVLAAPGEMPRHQRPAVRLAGLGSASDHLRLGDRADVSCFAGKRAAAAVAYRMAGLDDPRRQLDLAEIYDAFTGAELQSLEALGLAEAGGAAARLRAGDFDRRGPQPINLSGGLIGQGGAPGATGIAQIATVARLLEGRYFAELQPQRELRLGLAEAHSGVATVNFVTLLAAEDWP